MSLAFSNAVQARANPSPREHLYARGKDWMLYRGDCLEVMSGFAEETFDLVFADPPYFLSNGGFTCKSGRRAPVDKGGWDESRGVEGDHRFTSLWLSAVKRVLKPSGTLWVSGTQHVIFSVGFALQRLGFKLLNTVTWYKPNASPNLSCRYFTHSTEILVWASPCAKGKLLHRFNYARMKEQNGGKQMRDVWNLPRAGEEELSADGRGRLWSIPTPRREEKALGGHPTQKPLALLERVVQASSEDDALVLDPFSGSGTTGVASVRLGRRYVGIELDPKYLELSRRRLESSPRPRP
ncbi:MAG: site-specific DNA-methyltransferase [Myxococcales bacterium]|nr:site-specific DNA-methyltransferase [Myxococcales bacterium]